MGKTCWPRGGFSVCWWSTIYIDDGCFIVGTWMPHVHDMWTNAWSNALPGMGALVRGCSSPRRASCLRSSPRTWARWHARGPDTSHVGPMICAWASPPTCMSRGLRAYQGVNAHIQRFACELHATPGTVVPNTHRLSRNSPVSTFSPRWSAIWAPHHPESRPQARNRDLTTTNRGICIIRGATRRRHAERRLQMLQNPHYCPWRQAPSRMQGPSLAQRCPTRRSLTSVRRRRY